MLKKLWIFLCVMLTSFSVFVLCITPVSAESVSEYNEFCEKIEIANSLDESTIEKYQQNVEIVDGRYFFNSSEENEEILEIKKNISIVNSFVDMNEGFLTEDGLVLYCEDELSTQFGFTSVKWHWYGVDLIMDKEMIFAVCVSSLVVNCLSARMLTSCIKNHSFSSIESCISSYISSLIGTASKSISLFGNRGYAYLINKYGSYENFSRIVNSVISTTIYAACGVLAVAFTASCGVGAIVWTIISYVIGTFTPGLISTSLLLLNTICGYTTSAEMRIRWCCGWGTNLYY